MGSTRDLHLEIGSVRMRIWILVLAAGCNVGSGHPGPAPPGPPDENAADGYLLLSICGAVAECGCDAAFASLDTCGDSLPDAPGWLGAAQAAGLEFDGDCAFAIGWQSYSGEYNCESAHVLDCEAECQYFSGDKSAGEACTIYGAKMSDCSQGLVCDVDGVCKNACDRATSIAEGRACGYGTVGVATLCADGLTCDEESVCSPTVADGELCGGGSACAEQSACVEGACEPLLSTNKPCLGNSECASGICTASPRQCAPPGPLACSQPTW